MRQPLPLSGRSQGCYAQSDCACVRQRPKAPSTANWRSSLMLFIVSLYCMNDFSSTLNGLLLAVVSGAIASSCGYVIWYAALPSLSATRAATVQLSVPAIASFGEVILLSEDMTLHLLVASAAMLGGVAIVLAQRAAKTTR